MKNPWRWKFALVAIIVNAVTMTVATVAWLLHHIYAWSLPIILLSGAFTIFCNCKIIAGAVAWGNRYTMKHVAEERDQLSFSKKCKRL